MTSEPLPRKLAAILYADVAGYSRLTGEDEEGTHRRLSSHLDLISEAVRGYRGRVVHYAGDAVLAEFDTVTNALTCAAAIQRDLTERNSDLDENQKVQFRIGVNLGEVIIDRDDIYGDGVNVAARLESLAEPGSICVSETVRTSAGHKLPLEFEFMGEQQVKNIAEPVRAYKVRLERDARLPAPGFSSLPKRRRVWPSPLAAAAILLLVVFAGLTWWQPWTPRKATASLENMAFPFPDKPSVAVLPFNNLSGDPEQAYFADGMTEDLITDLSRISGLFVIARNSSFVYKGRSPDVRQVARELGVKYVLEGSVRRAGDQVRINAQLIDATTGGHLWAERYDGSIANVFALQDKVTKKIVNALAVNLTAEEKGQPSPHAGVNTEAYDAFLQGWAHYRLQTPDNMAAAVSAFERAITLNPGYAYAHAALAAAYWQGWENGWVKKLNKSSFGAMKAAKRHLQQAMTTPTPLAHWVASKISASEGKYEDAVKEAERAVALDRNDSTGYAALASALILAGEPTEGVDVIRQAMRLDPHYPPTYLITLGQAEFGMDRFEDAVTTLKRAVQRTPENEWALVYLAAAYGHLGKTEEGQAVVETFDELRKQRGLGELTSQYIDYGQFGQSLNRARLKEGLASIPEAKWKSLIRRTAAGYEVHGATVIDAASAKALHEQGALFVYTISIYGDWVEGRIPGSVQLEPHRLSNSTLRQLVGKQQAVVFYGIRESFYSGQSAAQATAKAINLGFKNVYYFPSGLDAWRTAGYPVEEGP